MSLTKLIPLWDWKGPADDLMSVLASIGIPDDIISGFSINPKECMSVEIAEAKLQNNGYCTTDVGQIGTFHVLSIVYYEVSGSECYRDSKKWCNPGNPIQPNAK